MNKIIILLSLCVLLACTTSPNSPTASKAPGIRETASVPPLDTEIGEYKVRGEDEATKKLMNLFTTHMREKYEKKGTRALRAVHAKSHGCMDADFEVFDHGDRELQYGVFKKPASYKSFVRFSNGDGPAGPDTDKMISIGLAFKILNVGDPKLLQGAETTTQDFMMINQPAFLVADIVQFADLIEAREGNVANRGIFAVTHPDTIKFRQSASPKDSPFNTNFWSALSFKLGNTAVKYMARPCSVGPKETSRDPDFLSILVKKHIENRDACFDVFLQKRPKTGDLEKNWPIENARVIWDEKISQPIRVARLSIPQQYLNDSQRPQVCRDVEYTPWNTTKDFRPLGNLNRIRRAVYELSAQQRQKLNHTRNPYTN